MMKIQNVMSSRLFNWILFFTIIGEFLFPFILGRYYKEYDGKTMVMSALGSPQSPVRVIYNVWLIWIGGFLLFVAIVYYLSTKSEFPILSVLLFFSIGVFAIGAGLISGIFSVNERYNYYGFKDTWRKCCYRIYDTAFFAPVKWNYIV